MSPTMCRGIGTTKGEKRIAIEVETVKPDIQRNVRRFRKSDLIRGVSVRTKNSYKQSSDLYRFRNTSLQKAPHPLPTDPALRSQHVGLKKSKIGRWAIQLGISLIIP